MSDSSLKIVIVGGVAAGASAAARARRLNESAEITILEKGPAVSFANCGLPYHVGGEIADRDKLLVATPKLFRERFNIDVRTLHEVTGIDRKKKSVAGIDHASGNPFVFPYDKLILAPGAVPVVPPFVAVAESAVNLFTLWSLTDMDRLIAEVRRSAPKRAAVIGAGFIGLEVAEQFRRLGLEVDLVERLPHVLPPLDLEFARLVEEELVRQGVKVHVDAEVSSLQRNGDRVDAVVLSHGLALPSDLVVVGVGVKPRTWLAQEAGLSLGPTGAIQVDEHQRTSDPSIYAAGDATEVRHHVLSGPRRVPLAGPANRAGRIAGEHAATGRSLPNSAVAGTAIVRVFDRTAAVTGIGYDQTRREGMDAREAIIQSTDHAGYFPGAEPMTLKIVYEPGSGRLLGAQAVGGAGVDKRIDVIATAIAFGGTVYDLAGLDLAYAPPYGSAKDPVHMAAFAAINDLDGSPRLLPPGSEIEGLQVVDVRTAAEREKLPLDDGIPIPIDELRERVKELDAARPTVTVCDSGKRAHVAAQMLRGLGFADVSNLTGGMSVRRLTRPAG